MLSSIARLTVSALGLSYVLLAPSPHPGIDEAICLAILAVLRLHHWQPAQTRMDHVQEALLQALYLALFLCLLRLPEIATLAELIVPFAVAAGALAGMLAYGLNRPLPLGEAKSLTVAASVVVASGATALVSLYWSGGTAQMAVVWALTIAVFLTIPSAIHLHAPIAARSRAEFSVTEVTNRLIFGLSLSLLIFGTKPDFWMGLMVMLPLMLAVSAFRIWRWNGATA